jgi:hypothetical protein
MLTLGAQMTAIIERRFKKIVPEAAVPLTEEIFDKMVENTRSGRTFNGLYYDTKYETKYAERRSKKGYQTSYTDFRFSTNPRITQKKPGAPSSQHAEMGFMDNPNKRGITAGNIFYYHQTGIDYKNGKIKIRQIMPIVWDNVPKDIYKRFIDRIMRVINGG